MKTLRTLTKRINNRKTKSEINVDFQRLLPIQKDRLTTWIIGQKALSYAFFYSQIRMIVSRLFAKQRNTAPVDKLIIIIIISYTPFGSIGIRYFY